jgi:hypothetical protein
MKHTAAVKLLLFLLSVGAFAPCRAADLGMATAPPHLNGTFLQLSATRRNWTGAQWAGLFDGFRSLRLSQVVVQWTVAGTDSFYKAARPDGSALGRILDAADRSGIRVWVGLYHDPEYWNQVGSRREATASYLREIRGKSLAIAHDLAPLVQRHPGFAGWYLSEEIDDINWLDPERREDLLAHLKLTSSGLQNALPASKVAVSTFSNGRMSPGGFREFWQQILQTSSISLVLLQDGIGVQKLELNELPLYAEALAAAASETGRECGIVIELFQQTAGAPLDAGEFAAVSAPMDRVRRQLAAAARFTGSLMAFSVPEYMSVTGVGGAERLLTDYTREVLGQGRD